MDERMDGCIEEQCAEIDKSATEIHLSRIQLSLQLQVYMELSPLRFHMNLSTNFSSSDCAFWRTAMEMAAASYLSSGSPMAAILSAVSSSLSDP